MNPPQSPPDENPGSLSPSADELSQEAYRIAGGESVQTSSSSGEQYLPEPQGMPAHDQSSTEENHPFIEPQLDDGGASRNRLMMWYVSRFALVFVVVGVLFGGSYGVYKGITSSSKKEQIVAVDTSDSDAESEQEIYEGDGSDITETAEPSVYYSCPDGYKLDESKEEETPACNGEKVEKVALTTSYSCPDGFSKNGEGENTTCSKYVGGSSISRNATVKYSCPSGYTMSGTSCKKKISTKPTTTYSCPSGYTLNNTSCTKTTLTYGTVRSSCPTGYTKKGTGANATCQRTVARKADGSCPKGYVKIVVDGKKKCRRTIGATLSCDSGFTKYGTGTSTTCRKYTVTTISATGTKVCPSGYTLSGSTCYKTVTRSRTKNYSCPSGYSLSGSMCYGTSDGKYESTEVQKTTSCKKGFKKTSDSKRCEKRTANTTDAVPNYTCEDGWELVPDDEPFCVQSELDET